MSIIGRPPRDTEETHPRVRCDHDTFEEWSEKCEAHYQVTYGRGSRQRSLFDICGQTVAMETHVPLNFLKQITEVWKCTDFNVTKDSDVMELAKRFDGEWEQGYYAEEGYGWPVFADAEHCWLFIHLWKSRKN